LLAANLGGIGKGFVGLAMFIAGLLAMNTVMTASAVGLFGFSSRLPRFQFVVTGFTAIYSLAVGAFFLFGSAGLLPPLG
jgi:high-affinity nickel-transport protein